MAQGVLIDQAFLEKLERLTLHWRKSFTGAIGGRRPSRFSGPGQEFLDHRNFHQGDDLRAVNWRAYMRLEKLFLKMFQIEPRIPVRLLLDVSASMGTGGGAKFEYAQRLTAALSYVGLVRLDTIHLQPFHDRLLESFICSGGRHRFQPAVRYLSSLSPSGTTNYMQVAKQFANNYPQRGLLLVISDFLDGEDACRPLQYLAELGHELLLIQLWSKEDREPSWDGQVELTDAETGDYIELSLDSDARAAYTRAFDGYAMQLTDVANRNGGRYVPLSIETSLEEAIFSSLMHSGGVQ
jgi:uncharacterized protein (DUF58 family)